MIQFLKNIWYAQRNALMRSFWEERADGWRYEAFDSIRQINNYRSALAEIASSNANTTNGTVRKHVRIAREALGWEE